MAGKSPVELLTPDPNRIPSFLSDKIVPIICGALGFGCVCYVNWGSRRPVFSGVQKHVLASTIGVVLGKIVDQKRNEYLSERDAVLRHYIELHPEDFPAPERKKFADILQPWIPIR
ncbi:NADH dehydrogenase [ubiquinone] 1 subunit C2 [Chrysoperla carnea]|uniref:NADH dehydrogenase [ubiquinone] 1 subunit C2 n=1 Tax=Chrysoperla carnea TaxID=189513 RepID=UPI001D09822B|nr:NADH dehydrogenase [ubiquinone] 1 subunit C2 [Chrysoperla carnea]